MDGGMEEKKYLCYGTRTSKKKVWSGIIDGMSGG